MIRSYSRFLIAPAIVVLVEHPTHVTDESNAPNDYAELYVGVKEYRTTPYADDPFLGDLGNLHRRNALAFNPLYSALPSTPA